MIPVYIILGTTGSGRREIVFHLIADAPGQDHGTSVILVSEDEAPSAFDEQLCALPHAMVLSWQLDYPDAISAEARPADASAVYFLTDGRADPADQIELLRDWISGPGRDLELARILTVVDCQLAQANPAVLGWYEACVHFADVVLLNRREGVPNKWVDDYQRAFHRARYPCLFERVKKGRVRNPAEVLYPEARRLSLYFDDFTEAAGAPAIEILIEGDFANSDDPEGDPGPDPFIERNDSGQRSRPLPDIAPFVAR